MPPMLLLNRTLRCRYLDVDTRSIQYREYSDKLGIDVVLSNGASSKIQWPALTFSYSVYQEIGPWWLVIERTSLRTIPPRECVIHTIGRVSYLRVTTRDLYIRVGIRTCSSVCLINCTSLISSFDIAYKLF